MTNILAIDTTLGACSTAIGSASEVIGCNREIRTRGHVERLLPMIDETFDDSPMSIESIDYITVTKGPGTFAGVRIGLAAAKGLALALDVPIIAITSLEALAFEFAQSNSKFDGKIAVLIDARRGEVYMQSFKVCTCDIKPIDEPKSSKIEDVLNAIAGDVKHIIGSACVYFEDSGLEIHKEPIYPNAASMLLLAEKKIGEAQMSDDVEPLYLRAPDAVKPESFSIVISDEA